MRVKDLKNGHYRILLEDPLSGDFILDVGLGVPKEDGGHHHNIIRHRARDIPIIVSIDVGDGDSVQGGTV